MTEANLNPATIDFTSLREQAMAHPAGNDDVTAAPSSEPAPAPDIVSSAPAPAEAPAPTLSPAELKVLELPDDAHVRVKVDGQEQVLPVHEFKDGISREAVFTKRMQTLAEQRRSAEAELAAQYAYVQQQAAALQQAQAWMQQQAGLQAPAPQEAPAAVSTQLQDLATVGDVQSQIQQAVAQLAQYQQQREQQFVSALGQATQRVQEDVALQRDATAYTKGLQSVLSRPEYAALTKALPYADQTIRYEVANMDPQSIEQAVAFTEQVAKGYMDSLRTVSQDLQVRQSVAQARAKLEPPAGSPPAPSPAYKPGSAFGKNGFDWNALRARAEQMMG
ncbi:MAG: hypothetical protein EBS05_26155 [Proteobacteria bacterium]|nr:hypothetical protein [Pseudomonadota bacterium]